MNSELDTRYRIGEPIESYEFREHLVLFERIVVEDWRRDRAICQLQLFDRVVVIYQRAIPEPRSLVPEQEPLLEVGNTMRLI